MMLSKWLHSRLWCGILPSFHLLSQDEAEQEKRISEIYFDSSRFVDLRMKIRLKLKELPMNSQSPRFENPAVYWDMLELFDEYLPLVLSIQRYHWERYSNSTTLPNFLTTFPALFYGFGGLNLLPDRLIGEQCAEFTIPLELVLVLCTMGQLHASYAESQIGHGSKPLTKTNWPAMQQAEMSWQSAESFFRWTSLYAAQVKDNLRSNDLMTRSIQPFFEAIAVQTTMLARMSSCHRLSTHISSLSLTEMRPERLFRIASVCARRALTLVREADSMQITLSNTRFSQQLRWCLSAYEIQWTAIYYQCELAIYRLDAKPEIAFYFCDRLLKLQIPHLSSTSAHQQDQSFSQLTHEIQLKHQSQLSEALDLKKRLLNECRGKFKTKWGFQALEKSFGESFAGSFNMGPVFSDEQCDGSGIGDEEDNYASPFLVEMIAANIEEAIIRAEVDGSPVISVAVKGPKEAQNLSAVQQETRRGKQLVDIQIHSNSTPVDSFLQAKVPISSSGWVTMNYKGKLLHFEKAVDSFHTNQSTTDLDGSLQSSISTSSIPRQSKLRPASSPSYFSSKRTPKPSESTIRQFDNSNMWAPTRASCALCDRRFMRTSLPGVVVMKRIYDLRRKWGVIQGSKKFNAPSALYGTAQVCLLCQEILAFDEHKKSPAQTDRKTSSNQLSSGLDDKIINEDKDVAITRMIHDSILYQWHQEPPNRVEAINLQDIAVNKRVRQSSTVCSMKAQNALLADTNCTAHTKEEFQPWWEIDLANYVEVHSVKVYLRDEVSHLYAAARGLAANPSRQPTGVYPLHLSISMKTGVGRDCDDIIASCVSSLCVKEKSASAIEWLAPHTSRGRFVRIQCENRAILHIEHVYVYVTKPSPAVPNDPVIRRQHFRKKLQRAAFCASVIATTASPVTTSNRVPIEAKFTSKRRLSTFLARTTRRRGSATTKASQNGAEVMFFDPERAEKRRVSRLYERFKSLLDARAKYVASEVEINDVENDESS